MSIIKKFLTIAVALTLMFSIIGCSLVSSPENAVDSYLTAIEKKDFATAAKYVKPAENDSSELVPIAEDPKEEEILLAICSKISHETISSTQTGNTAQVVTSITSPDMLRVVSAVMSELMPLAFASAFSNDPNNDKTDQLLEQYFMNALTDPNIPLTTQEVTINLIKENNQWLILADDSLANALTGNLGVLADSLNSIDLE